MLGQLESCAQSLNTKALVVEREIDDTGALSRVIARGDSKGTAVASELFYGRAIDKGRMYI